MSAVLDATTSSVVEPILIDGQSPSDKWQTAPISPTPEVSTSVVSASVESVSDVSMSVVSGSLESLSGDESSVVSSDLSVQPASVVNMKTEAARNLHLNGL